MNTELSHFAARLCGLIQSHQFLVGEQALHHQFDSLALELFNLQFHANAAYRKICEVRQRTPQTITHWTQIPAVPTAAFKELELSCIPPEERTAVFHSSGTTEQKPSRHFHCAESLAVYEASLWIFFHLHSGDEEELVLLTPPPKTAPHSSLIHMFETVRRNLRQPESAFTGMIAADGSWTLNFSATLEKLKSASNLGQPITLLGTAFSFVHLLDYLADNKIQFQLPKGSRVMETGGYKNRSRVLPKNVLHALIGKMLGVEGIICEYGMSELSSQAYDTAFVTEEEDLWPRRFFQFPPWARVQIISPETGLEVAVDERGLIRVFDLANVFSVMAIQTEDLGIRDVEYFDLLGRAQLAEPRGCSLMNA